MRTQDGRRGMEGGIQGRRTKNKSRKTEDRRQKIRGSRTSRSGKDIRRSSEVQPAWCGG